MTASSVLNLIGNTPLLRLKGASELTGCEILGKAEFLNPGQSVKDRAALSIIRAAEEDGSLKPGGIVVEGTAGNTGIGLAMVCSALGYRCKIVMPRTQSQEKKDAVKLLGAELIEVDGSPMPILITMSTTPNASPKKRMKQYGRTNLIIPPTVMPIYMGPGQKFLNRQTVRSMDLYAPLALAEL